MSYPRITPDKIHTRPLVDRATWNLIGCIQVIHLTMCAKTKHVTASHLNARSHTVQTVMTLTYELITRLFTQTTTVNDQIGVITCEMHALASVSRSTQAGRAWETTRHMNIGRRCRRLPTHVDRTMFLDQASNCIHLRHLHRITLAQETSSTYLSRPGLD